MNNWPAWRIRGFALAESLVALTLLSLGLASTVAILVQCLRQERESSARTATLRLAASLAEELRVLQPPDGRALLSVTGVPPDLACAQRPESCAVESAAADLMVDWQRALALQAPAGATGTVAVPDPEVPAYRIRITWQGTGESVDSVLQLVVEA